MLQAFHTRAVQLPDPGNMPMDPPYRPPEEPALPPDTTPIGPVTDPPLIPIPAPVTV